MELMIGKNLRNLRRSKDLTQEEVAAHLGISFQAISKWERNDGYPDITMLPALANYFGVSVDELIGMDDITSAAKLDEINQKWTENRAEKKHKENVELMREALKTYPNHPILLSQLYSSLEKMDGTEAEKRENLRESIAIQEQILRYCDDSEARGSALFNIADAYYRYGDHEKALQYAKKLPNLFKTRETALVMFLNDNEKKHTVAMDAMDRIAWLLSFHLQALAETENDKHYYEKMLAVLDILFDGNESDFVKGVRNKMTRLYKS